MPNLQTNAGVLVTACSLSHCLTHRLAVSRNKTLRWDSQVSVFLQDCRNVSCEPAEWDTQCDSELEGPEMNMLRFTKGMATAPCRPRRSPDLASERRWREGTALADPKVRVGFPAEVCEPE